MLGKSNLRLQCREGALSVHNVFILGSNASKGASLLSLLVNLPIFERALKTHVPVLLFSHF
ncbi:hypothetical protein I79_024949 [Cricetulus griseus]|uniref:Uncharacterized protein n=1 Tax=Cricetulus griseus TaxID=10029 RepID=G3IM19_CRIGR|nr:hypothetical protein I79_024949 [Cricetulus griseus]